MNVTFPDFLLLERVEHVFFGVEYLCRARKAKTFLACDFCHGSFRREIALEDLYVSCRFYRVLQWMNDGLFRRKPRKVFHILLKRLSRDGHAIPVEQALGEKHFCDSRYASDAVQVFHHVLTAWFEVGKKGDAIAYTLKVVDRQFDADRPRHRNQMKNSVGGPAHGCYQDDRVLESLTCHDVAWFEVQFEEISNGGSRAETFFKLEWVFGRCRGTVGQRHSEHLDCGGHRVRGVHATAGTGPGARVTDDLAPAFFVDSPGEILPVALKSRDHIELLPFAVTGLNGSAVDHERRSIESSHGDKASRHVLVATWK